MGGGGQGRMKEALSMATSLRDRYELTRPEVKGECSKPSKSASTEASASTVNFVTLRRRVAVFARLITEHSEIFRIILGVHQNLFKYDCRHNQF